MLCTSRGKQVCGHVLYLRHLHVYTHTHTHIYKDRELCCTTTETKKFVDVFSCYEKVCVP